jgi:hypothetical protein
MIQYRLFALCCVFLVMATMLLSMRRSQMPVQANTAAFQDELAQATWNYLRSDWATDQHLPWSWRSETLTEGDFANPTEIGFYALSWLGAYEMNQAWSPTWNEVETEVIAVLDQLRAWQTNTQAEQPYGPNSYGDSVFYQWYWINYDPPIVGENVANNQLVPSVDNAWLAASLRALPINQADADTDLFGRVKRPSNTRMEARYSQPSLEPGS